MKSSPPTKTRLPYRNESERWQAVLNRDPLSDGAFFYAVVTTGVYCRPVCNSRRPKRENVRYFASAQQAQNAGFRACRKCRPADPAGSTTPPAIAQACALILQSDRPLALQELSQAVGLSPHYFHRLFTKHVGVTPKSFASEIRSDRFRKQLRQTESVTAAMYKAGYKTSSRCYAEAQDRLGMTPAEFKAGGSDQTMRLRVTKCHLGWAAVVASDRGICAVELGDDPQQIETRVRRTYPHANCDDSDTHFANMVDQVVQWLSGAAPPSDLPLDVQGTAFQHRVWAALRKIPVGETRTYKQLAEALGQPKAARAVARACATNPVAVVIPCHRVIRENGGLAGYRWGIERKQQLLREERRNVDDPGTDE